MKLTHYSLKISILGSVLCLVPISLVNAASSNEWWCKSYAQDAVAQNAKNISAKCGFTGLRWNSDKAGQKQWCLGVKKSIASKENNIREDMLTRCFTEKSSRNNPDNQLPVPTSCKDPSASYIPVRNLYTEFRYERELHVPVGENGLIRYDFNGDGKQDYLFAENNAKNNVRLISCFSNQAGSYKRNLTGVNFYADSFSLASDQYTISLKKHLLTIDVNYFGHNEGSCFTKGVYAYKPNAQHFSMVDSVADCSPVIGVDGEPYPMSPPALPSTLK